MHENVQLRAVSLALCSVAFGCRTTPDQNGDDQLRNLHQISLSPLLRENFVNEASTPDEPVARGGDWLDPQYPRRDKQAEVDPAKLVSGGRFIFGYKSTPIDYSFVHDTHPDDSFLPNSQTPGSAGKTEISRQGSIAIGGGYQIPLSESFLFTIDGGLLIGGHRNEHQNDNDSRPAANGAFVFSEAYFGGFAATGVEYRMGRFYLGAEAQVVGYNVVSGWDRFGNDQSQQDTMVYVPSIGPRFGYQIGSHDPGVAIEATLAIGDELGFGIQFVFRD